MSNTNTNSTMPVVNASDLGEYIKHSITLDQPLFIWGSPGIGKSQIVAAVAKEIGAELCDIRLAQFASVDLMGLPDVDQASGTTTWRVPSAIPFVGSSYDRPELTSKPIILFLDEAMQASPAVQAAAFQLVLDRRIGGHYLLPNVHIIAASNRETDKAGVQRMLSPLANRFMHVEAEPSLEGWVKWARGAGVPDALVAYIRFRPDNLDKFEQAAAGSVKAFATPRSWAVVGKIVAAGDKTPANVLMNLIGAAVGIALAAEFMAFLSTWQSMPDIAKVFKAPTKAEVPTEPSMLFAITAALANAVCRETDGAKQSAMLKALHTYGQRLPREFVVKTMLDLVRRDSQFAAHPVMADFMADNGDLLLM